MDGYASVQVTPRNSSDRASSFSPLALGQLFPSITEMWRMCICSSTISEGSWSVGAVARASCPELLMDTWKYRVPFSSHCCLQCTSEISAAVPDISARQDPRYWVSCVPGLRLPGREAQKAPTLHQYACPHIKSMSQMSSFPFIDGSAVAKFHSKQQNSRGRI